MIAHRHVAAFVAACLAIAAAWIVGWSSWAASRAPAGARLVAIFPPGMSGAEAMARLAASPAVRFEPLGFAPAWIAEAGREGLAAELRARGSLLVVAANGPVRFSIGCASASRPAYPARGR